MRCKRIATIMVIGILLAWSAPNASADALILNVPDWNQPNNYVAAEPKLNNNDYPQWCSPTAGANIMGYWEDVKGCTGLTDQTDFYNDVPNSPGYPGTAGTWEQGLWHDGTVEMGWHMDTGSWQTNAGPFPPGVGMTNWGAINAGLLGYATGSWTDNDYPPPPGVPNPGTGIVKVAYPNTTVTTQNFANTPLAAMWPVYTAEIDAARPVECSFDRWVNTMPLIRTKVVNGQTVEFYAWSLSGVGHSVVGVGYIDSTPATYDGNEFFICQDNWAGPGMGAGGTGQYVAVPVDDVWQQNDYVTNVPEPFTMTLLVLGSAGLILRRKR